MSFGKKTQIGRRKMKYFQLLLLLYTFTMLLVVIFCCFEILYVKSEIIKLCMCLMLLLQTEGLLG